MTAAASATIAARPIHVVDVSGDAVPVPHRARPARRRGTSVIAATAFAVAVVLGTAIGAELTGAAAQADSFTPVAGDFRLAPGNQEPPGVVQPASTPADGGFGPVPGEYRLAPGNLEPVGVVGY